jgi:MFS family permease
MSLSLFRPWLVVALLWFVALLNYFDRLMLASMHDPIKESIPMTDAQFGLLTSVFLWSYGFLSPIGGYLADRFGRSRVIMGSLFVWSLATGLTGQAHTLAEMLCVRTLMGVSEACYIPAALALISDYHRGKTRSLATGIHMSGIYAGAALGGLGGFIAGHYGWRAGFAIFGAVGLGYAVLLALLLRDASPGPGISPAAPMRTSIALRSLALEPAFWLLFLVSALVGVANWSVNAWLPTYLQDHFHLTLGVAGLSATGFIQVASFAGVLAGGFLADRWSRQNPRARSLLPAIGFCLVSPFLFVASSTAVLAVAIAGLMVYGLGRGFFDANLMPILRQSADERFSATGYGIFNFIGCATGGLMIYAGGLLKDMGFGLNVIFQLSSICLLIAGLFLFRVKPRIRGI